MRSAAISRRQMAIAEMPGDARERGGVAAAHLDQVLLGRLDLDEAALLQLQAVAGVQHDGLDQVEQEVEAAIAQHAQAAAIAVVEQQGDGVGALGRRPVAGAHDFDGAFHCWERATPWRVFVGRTRYERHGVARSQR